MRKGRSGSPKVGGSATRGKQGGGVPQSAASPKDAKPSQSRRGKTFSTSPSESGGGGSVNQNMRTPVASRGGGGGGGGGDGGGDSASPGTPASRRKGSDTPRTPLTTLAVSSNVAPSPSSEAPLLHSPFFGAQSSPGWNVLHDGTPGLSDSVVSEQANFLVRRRRRHDDFFKVVLIARATTTPIRQPFVCRRPIIGACAQIRLFLFFPLAKPRHPPLSSSLRFFLVTPLHPPSPSHTTD